MPYIHNNAHGQQEELYPLRIDFPATISFLNKFALPNKDASYANADRGWHSLTAMILLQAVSDACQNEDILLAAEARDWLASKSANVLFGFCNLNHQAVKIWLANGCPLPSNEEIARTLSAYDPNVSTTEYLGFHFGLLPTHEEPIGAYENFSEDNLDPVNSLY